MGFTYFYLRNKRDDIVVDFRHGTDDTPLIGFAKKALDLPNDAHPFNQLMEFDLSATPPYFFITNRQTGEVIDAQGVNPGTAVIAFQRKATGTGNQLWTFVPSDETERYFFIANQQRGDQVITVTTANQNKETPLIVSTRLAPAADSQLWSIEKAT